MDLTAIRQAFKDACYELAPLVASGANADFASLTVTETRTTMEASYNSNSLMVTEKQ